MIFFQSSVLSILKNEKYKCDALLQKYFTKDFLTHKRVNNNGEVPQYYVEGHHEGIVTADQFEQVQVAIAENSRMALDQNEYVRRYAGLTERYNTIKADYDKISEQIESKKAQRELFKGFIRALEKQGALVEEFDEGLWSSLVQEVVVKSKDDILFIFKNGFKIKTR